MLANIKFHSALLAVVLTISALSAPTRVIACNNVIQWYADLKGSNETPSIDTQDSGKATFIFNFEHPEATIKLDTQNITDVKTVELRFARTQDDMSGPTLVVLYDSKDGKLPGTISKTIRDLDIVKQTTPKVEHMQDIVNTVLNGMAVVAICTKAHPQGEIAGRISMHKTVVFSDDPNNPFHDPSLHNAAHAAQPATPPADAAQATPPDGDKKAGPAPTTPAVQPAATNSPTMK